MIKYKNLNRDSGVFAFEIGIDYIIVHFTTGKNYMYSHRSAGIDKVNRMFTLANAGRGLNSYINKFAKFNYE